MKKEAPSKARERQAIKRQGTTVEREYGQMFTTRQLPFHGLYTDEDSLEQPSQLKYVSTVTTPAAVE